ncbi:hypothetical protein [Tengunoibacter tsumagoiensis]|uniref:Uncharacterized protein n=1 Tax=Tengunoibacter tsumagoiensis TaxID=2014871 RepID=A0A401ZZP2_9CHLR|nr:hypothetical protein [Tengunoibacter tsumagoiensis]GCE12313.1 hypothetical protein KTT_21720 [Tengunoibacter tsumagoiensis]
MIQTLVLATEGYRISFELKPIEQRPDAFETTITFFRNPRLDMLTLTSSPVTLSRETLQRLVTYFEQHMMNMQDESFGDSIVFVPMNLQFQVQALAGDRNGPDDGAFSLRFMLNMERPDEEISSIYVGAEAIITFEQTNRFLSDVKKLLGK